MHTPEETVKKPFFIVLLLSVILTIMILGSCSREMPSYDQLVKEGRLEDYVRKQYGDFFKAVHRLTQTPASTSGSIPDSTLIKRAAQQTDKVIADVLSFPETVNSRFAFDALSYAAQDLSVSGKAVGEMVSFFWENALIDPLLTRGLAQAKTDMSNESTHIQIIQALQRGMGDKATGEMLMRIIPIVGPTPSPAVMEVCKSDSLVFRKIHDLIIYSRSLQRYGPPLWMTTGKWLMALETEGWPVSFFCLEPIVADKSLYLAFREYDQGSFYAAVFDDPVPEDTDKTDAWLTRAAAVMGSLTIDEEIAKRITQCSLPTHNTHTFYNDYLIHTDADSVKKEFTVVLKRDKVYDSTFEFAGIDSITVNFTTAQIDKPDGLITRLAATRFQGPSMSGSRSNPGHTGTGTAYLVPLGTHDTEMLDKIRNDSQPEITVNTK